MVADERLQIGAVVHIERRQVGVGGAVQEGQRRVAVQVQRGERVVIAAQFLQGSVACHVERGQGVVLAIDPVQRRATADVERGQLAVARDCGSGHRRVAVQANIGQVRLIGEREARQLVVAGIELLQIGHRVDGAQVGDLAVLTVQVGEGRAIGQASDGRQVGVLVATQALQCRVASHVERGQGVVVALDAGQRCAVRAVELGEVGFTGYRQARQLGAVAT